MIQFLTSPSTSQYLVGIIFMMMGILHFLKPGVFAAIIPDFIPWHKAMVYISGVAEIAGGLGVLLPPYRAMAAWGLLLLLLAVFPANINMAVQAIQKTGLLSWYAALTILRLPLQFVLMYWVYWACLLQT
ncbi:DoxX family protein [Fodinibius salsisoli]|uniref:DoxX-like family protein n=1 Tax=Fodinibius salsisoli TaxID=2820877 RepID=A0ABT3PRG0_9BACT|nr:hypothetical protein [Fodinibius salsisoli]MCW9708416.1 hypothetical protein [Fodinibius salsisoli]